MKEAGILLLSLIPLILCFRSAEEVREKEKRRQGFLDFLRHLHFQIEHFQKAQEEIFSQFHNKSLERIGFCSRLREELEGEPCGALGRVTKETVKSLGFSEEIKEAILEVTANFGLQSRASQLRELESAIKLLSEKEKTDKTECESKIKILRMAGITACFGMMILLG